MADRNARMSFLACPCCGSAGIVELAPREWGPYNNPYWKIECEGCGLNICGTHRMMNRERWNTRIPGPAVCEVVSMSERDGKPYTYDQQVCSKCGSRLAPTIDKVWQCFCPGCGARVRKEIGR